MKKLAFTLSAFALVLATGSATAAQSATPTRSVPARIASTWCVDGAPTPCVESASLNGTPITSSDPTWTVYVAVPDFSIVHSHNALWSVWKNGGSELGADSLDDTWVVTIDNGTVVPRVAFTHGDDVTVDRNPHGDGTYHVTVTATPVVLLGTCDQTSWPWTCPKVATDDWNGYLDGEISDYQAWDDVAQRNSMYGMNYASNVSATGLPPEIVTDPATGLPQVRIDLANPHFRADGTTVFEGFVHQRIPNAFLQLVYGIDDPTTLTGSGLAPVVTGSVSGAGSGSVTQESGGDAMLVDITGITFSARKLLIKRGVITPTRPTTLVAHRSSGTNGRVGFHAATPRGSRIVGYTVRCIHGSSVVLASGNASPISMTGLHRGLAYTCQAKARSKAGPGLWSAAVTMPAHVGG